MIRHPTPLLDVWWCRFILLWLLLIISFSSLCIFFFFLNLCNSLLGLASVSVSPVWPRHSSIWHEGIITFGHKTGPILIWQGKQFNSISTVLLVTERHLCVGDRIQCPLFLYPSAKVTGAEVQHPFQKQLCSTTQLSVVWQIHWPVTLLSPFTR